MKLKDSNDLFGVFIELKGKDNVCKITDVIDKTNIDSITLSLWVNELEEKKYIKQIAYNEIFIDRQHENKYLSPIKKIFYRIISILKALLNIISSK